MSDSNPQRTLLPFEQCLDRLETLHTCIWDHLEKAAQQPQHGWHLPIVGSAGRGDEYSLRTVVLRAADRYARTIVCHTDLRSPKIQQLRTNPRLNWLFYDRERRVQLRVLTTATIHTDDAIAHKNWENLRLESQRCYLAPLPPGTAITSPNVNLPEQLRDRPPTREEALAGRSNFAVVAGNVTSMDFLWLNQRGNLRAAFENPDDEFHASWIAP